MESDWAQAILPNSVTVGSAIRSLNEFSAKIVLVINEQGVFQGTVSDGDIRRGLLKGFNLESPIESVIHRNALVVPPELGREMVKQLMAANKIWQVPVVDEKNHIVGLHLWDEITKQPSRGNLMVIMAGGLGTRLHPFTENCPKPLLRVSGKPIVQHIIERAKVEGFSKFVLSIRHLGHMIEDYFGSGESLDVNINYLREDAPLGTAGALSFLDPVPDAPFIVTNGDVITDINYGGMIDFHVRNGGVATMAVREFEMQNPFGVVNTRGLEIIGFEEKPTVRSYINAGVYALNPDALNVLAINEPCDMPKLFERLRFQMRQTMAYPIHESWFDVGRPDDLVAVNNL